MWDRLGISALNRKLLRDLWEMRAQASAIAAVVAAGVTMYVTYLSNFDSLQRTRTEFYEQHRFADVFATSTRVPRSVETRLAAIPGVETVATRVVADVTLDVPGIDEPSSGRLVSIPERDAPSLNGLYLRSGRWIDPARQDEVLASEVFCEANGFTPGARVGVIINGRKRWLTIVGIALSPEYIYAVKPGEIFPDRRRFGVFWMGQRALASAFDMEGGFNDVALTLGATTSEPDVIAAVDRVLEPYGGLGAIPQRLQPSAWTLENELAQLQMFGLLVPLIFLGVAAFVLNVALTRALALQRQEIAALKALGYSNRNLAWHYVKWALVIAGTGAAVGVGSGAWLGSGMIGLYNQYFRFPVLYYSLAPRVAIEAVGFALVVAMAGAYSAVRRAVRIPPAEAMRPEAPRRFGVSMVERLWGIGRLSHATRMVVRNIERQPVRSLLSTLGIALAVAVLLVGLSFIDIMEQLVSRQFAYTMRQDATVSFARARSAHAVHDVSHVAGVMDIEPVRTVAARLRVGHRARTVGIMGTLPSPRLNRITNMDGRLVVLPENGLVMSRMLGDILHAGPGDVVEVDVLEGRRPTLMIPVTGLVDDALGLQSYMHIDALRRLLQEGPSITGAFVTLDPSARDAFYREVKRMPAVAGVALRDVIVQNFRETMAESMNMQIVFNVGFAVVIAFGVVYNAARVSLSERARDLASLRVLGFTRGEISLILLGELAALTLMALPIGALLGWGLGAAVMLGFNNEVYRLSFAVSASTVAWSCLTVVIAAALSGLLVRRRLDQLDLIAVLKTRE